MSEPVKPALTDKEWEQVGHASRGDYSAPIMAYQIANHGGYLYADRRHALGALCLYGQPFGFTQEDVNLLQELIAANPRGFARFHARAGSLLGRIIALLPPEDLTRGNAGEVPAARDPEPDSLSPEEAK